jgi:hypothetical protein
MASTAQQPIASCRGVVDGDSYAVITAREEYADLSRLEIAHPEWKRERGT